jgi:hypothetical protein
MCFAPCCIGFTYKFRAIVRVLAHPMTFPGLIKLDHIPGGIYFLMLKENGILKFRASVMKAD